MIDIELMRKYANSNALHYSSLKYGTHYERCYYTHTLCAILALCDELEQARAQNARMREALEAIAAYESRFVLWQIGKEMHDIAVRALKESEP